jgi:hypothetical protein
MEDIIFSKLLVVMEQNKNGRSRASLDGKSWNGE